ncbi:hypothetical protein LTR85_001588 [Meristemomyces frigidus]|nr:hypothetical protein LTR85_001588 [Meristemomyces frigidus]
MDINLSDKGAVAVNDRDGNPSAAMMAPPRTPLKTTAIAEENASSGFETSAVFRFFDLSPEMRNTVYRELLIFTTRQPHTGEYPSPEVSVCNPSVLTTCRQAYSEASSILYDENIFEIRLERADVATVLGRLCANDIAKLPHKSTQWPMILLKCRILHLDITAMLPNGGHYGTQYRLDRSIRKKNRALYDLAHFLIGSEVLETVHIKFDACRTLTGHHIRELTLPLKLVHAEKVITCLGDLAGEAGVIEELVAPLPMPKGNTSILREYHQVAREARKALARANQEGYEEH